MNKLYKKTLLLCGVLSLSVSLSMATAYYSVVVNGSMSSTASWNTARDGSGSAPADTNVWKNSANTFEIQTDYPLKDIWTSAAGVNLYINSTWNNANGTVGYIYIYGTLSQGGTLYVKNNWTNTGTYTHNNKTVKFNGSVDQTISPGNSFYYIWINPTGTAVFVNTTVAITVTYFCQVQTKQFRPFTGSTIYWLNIGNSGILYAPAVLNITAYWYNVGHFLHNNGTINFTGNAYIYTNTSFEKNFYTVNILSGTRTANTSVTIEGDLTISLGATFDLSTNNYSLTLGGNFSNNGTFNGRKSTVTFIGSNNSVISGSSTYTINNGGQLKISAGKTLTVSTTLTNNGGVAGLLIESTGSSITSTGSLIYNGTPNATVQRYLTGGAIGSIPAIKHYVSPTVSGSTGATLYDASLGGYNIYTYNGTKWIRVYTTNSLTPGVGYLVNYNANKTLSFTGPVNNGNINVSISSTNGMWNLLGNPYPCAISASAFVSGNSNLVGTLYFWSQTAANNNGDYASWNGTGTAGNSGIIPNGYIASGQGFMVASNGGGSTAYFTNSMKSTNNSPFFIPGNFITVQRFLLDITNPEGDKNEILIGFLLPATKDYDNFFDGIKLQANAKLALYSLIDNDTGKYIIQGLPNIRLFDSAVVRLGLWAGIDGKYTFNLNRLENFDKNINIYLEDLMANRKVNLRYDSTYSFNTEKGNIDNRFVLVFKKESSNVSIDNQKPETSINLYSAGRSLYITKLGTDDIKADIVVYNMLGKVVYSTSMHINSENEIDLDQSSGSYIVSIITEKERIIKKVILK